MSFEIVKGDYGRIYRGIVEDVDYSDCTAKMYVWNSSGTKVVDGKDCVVSFHTPDTWVDYIPATGDFNVVPGLYKALIKFEKSGVMERSVPFTWEVLDKEP